MTPIQGLQMRSPPEWCSSVKKKSSAYGNSMKSPAKFSIIPRNCFVSTQTLHNQHSIGHISSILGHNCLQVMSIADVSNNDLVLPRNCKSNRDGRALLELLKYLSKDLRISLTSSSVGSHIEVEVVIVHESSPCSSQIQAFDRTSDILDRDIYTSSHILGLILASRIIARDDGPTSGIALWEMCLHSLFQFPHLHSSCCKYRNWFREGLWWHQIRQGHG